MLKEVLVCSKHCGNTDSFNTREIYNHYILVNEHGEWLEDTEQEFIDSSNEYYCDSCGANAHWGVDADIEEDGAVIILDDVLPYNSPYDVVPQ